MNSSEYAEILVLRLNLWKFSLCRLIEVNASEEIIARAIPTSFRSGISSSLNFAPSYFHFSIKPFNDEVMAGLKTFLFHAEYIPIFKSDKSLVLYRPANVGNGRSE